MNKNIKRILAYGSSDTAGDEIMDHIVLGMTFEECNQHKMAYVNGKASLARSTQFKEDFKIRWDEPLHRSSSWAGQLAKLLNLEFENRATNGSGLDAQYFQIHSDYTQGLILDTDLVLVGLTSMNRIIDFRSKEKIRTLTSKNIPYDIGSKLLLDIFNDDFIVFQYFKTLSLLASLRSNINLLMQPMVNDMNQLDKLELIHSRLFADTIWKTNIGSMVLPEEYLQLPVVNGKEQKCAFGHPPVESHIELAGKMHKKLIDILSN